MQCWTSLQSLPILNRVSLSWVPGHCKIAGNEMAGKLERDGSAVVLPLARSTTQMMTKKGADNAHLNYWDSVTNCRQSKLWQVGCPALSIARMHAFGEPLLNEREYKQTTVSQIQTNFPLNHIQIPSPITLSRVCTLGPN
jgi:hypothetical protein